MSDVKFWIQVASVVIPLLGVILAIIRYGSKIERFSKQLNAQVFTTYTERYDRIMEELPDGFRVDSDSGIDDISNEDRKNILRYLNMCSEEFFSKRKRIFGREDMGNMGKGVQAILK